VEESIGKNDFKKTGKKPLTEPHFWAPQHLVLSHKTRQKPAL
jgi:hypothetical protein